jgi:hypothetical protein
MPMIHRSGGFAVLLALVLALVVARGTAGAQNAPYGAEALSRAKALIRKAKKEDLTGGAPEAQRRDARQCGNIWLPAFVGTPPLRLLAHRFPVGFPPAAAQNGIRGSFVRPLVKSAHVKLPHNVRPAEWARDPLPEFLADRAGKRVIRLIACIGCNQRDPFRDALLRDCAP